jgi:hypothetical protein
MEYICDKIIHVTKFEKIADIYFKTKVVGGILGWNSWVNFFYLIHELWRAPNSLKDSNVNPKQKTTEGQGVGARSLVRSTLEG